MASTGTSTRRAEADGHCNIRRSVMRDNKARFLLATNFALGGLRHDPRCAKVDSRAREWKRLEMLKHCRFRICM